jgi:putative transposase
MKNMSVRASRHSVYQTAYHFVWIPKYRRKVLRGPVAARLRVLLTEICESRDMDLLALEIQPDHVHIFVSAPPMIAPALAVQWLKGISARVLLVEFPALRKAVKRDHLWAPSFYVGTAGHVSAKTILQYIERAAHVRTRI